MAVLALSRARRGCWPSSRRSRRRRVIGRLSQLSYLAWPTKRRWSNRNFGHVLGLPPDHPPRPRRGAARVHGLRALSRRAHAAAVAAARGGRPRWCRTSTSRRSRRIWQEVARRRADPRRRPRRQQRGGRGGHRRITGCRSASSPTIRRSPRSSRSSGASARRWGVKIIAWRNLREIFGVLRRREILGLLVDWGYRSDGIPVRLFGAWTALPAGPATLAAKTRSRILPITIRRQPDDTFHVSWSAPIEVASSDPAELQRATQAIADALASTIAAAPDQWYSFKPIWPSTSEEAADLERRAALMLGGVADPGPARGVRLIVHGLGAPAPRAAVLRRRRGWPAGSPSGHSIALAELAGDVWYRPTPERAAQARRNLARVAAWLAAQRARDAARPSGRARPARAGTPGPPRLPARGALLPRGRPNARRCAGGDVRRATHGRDAGDGRGGVHARSARDLRRPALRRDRAAGAVPGVAGRRGGRADGDARRPRAAGLVHPDARRGRDPDRRPARGAARADGRPA